MTGREHENKVSERLKFGTTVSIPLQATEKCTKKTWKQYRKYSKLVDEYGLFFKRRKKV
jgi:hypothetical protein